MRISQARSGTAAVLGANVFTGVQHIEAGTEVAYVAKTANYTLTANNEIVDCTTGTFTLTLPTAVAVDGQTYILKNSGTGVITVATTSSQTIDGSATATLNQYDSITVISDGANWKVV